MSLFHGWLQRVPAFRSIQFLGLTLAALVYSASAFSQTNLGKISGEVVDPSGGVIAGAAVTVTDTERGVSRSLVTDTAGEFNAPSLTPGTYMVRGEFAGFKATERQNVLVTVGSDVRVDLTLQPGEQAQTVTVTEELPMVNTTNATISSTLENKEVTDIPVEGGNYIFLYSLRPGVQARPGGGAQQNSSNGVRTESNAWMLDGLFNTKVDNGGFMLSSTHGADGDQANIMPTDAIQEINFIENPKAEYGWRAGAVANVGLKSGTNTFHGTAHVEGRDTSLVARNPFIPASQGAGTNSFMQSGATVGGKLMKDKLFYFGAFEWQRSYVQIPKVFVVPTTQSGAGPTLSFPDAIAAVGVAKVNPLSAALAGCTLAPVVTCSSANQGEVGGDINTALFGNDQLGAGNQTPGQGAGVLSEQPLQHQTFNELIKMDYHPNDHNAFNGEFFQGGGIALSGGALRNFWRNVGFGGTQVVRGVWTWTPTATFVNDARFGYDFQSVPDGTGDCPGTPYTAPFNADYSKFGLVTGVTPRLPGNSTKFDLGSPIGIGTGDWSTCGFPTITITGFAALGNGGGTRSSNGYLQGVDSVTWTHGKHIIKSGVEIRWQKMDSSSFANEHGTISFTSLQNFLTGTVNSTGSTLLTGDPTQLLYNHNYGAFVQDDWRISPRVTLNLGLRWEYQQPWFEGSNANKYANFSAASCPPAGLTQTCSGLVQESGSSKIVTGQPSVVMPRFGIAWDVTGNGTSVLSVGAGMFYMGPTGRSLGSLGNDPSGGNFVRTDGSSFVGSGTITSANLNLPNSSINWTQCLPVGSTSCPVSQQTFGALGTGVPGCGNGIVPISGGGTVFAPCAISAMNPDIHLAYVSEWNLAFQHAFSSSLSWNVAYVGTHGTKLWGIDNINQPTVGITNCTTAACAGTDPVSGKATLCAGLKLATCEQISRPYYFAPGQVTETAGGPIATAAAPAGVPTPWFPWFAKINLISNMYSSNYNALQTSVTQRFSHGLTLNVSYTWQHSLSDGSTDEYFPQNSYNIGQQYGNDLNDIRHRATITASYALPGRAGFAQLLQGWTLNTAIGISSALPIEVQDTNSDISGRGDTGGGNSSTGAPSLRWDLYGNPGDFKPGSGALPCYGVGIASTMGKQPNCKIVASVDKLPVPCLNAATFFNVPLSQLTSIGCYATGMVTGSAIIPPAPGTFGTMTLDELRAKGFRTWDMTVTHDWKFKERYDARLIVAVYNVTNSTQYAGYGTNPNQPNTLGLASQTPDVAANSAVLGQGGPRRYNFGIKLTW